MTTILIAEGILIIVFLYIIFKEELALLALKRIFRKRRK